jgi:hypothetical protein
VLIQVASISQLTVSQLSRKCGILNISQPYRPSEPVTGIALLYFTFVKKQLMGNFKLPVQNRAEVFEIEKGTQKGNSSSVTGRGSL